MGDNMTEFDVIQEKGMIILFACLMGIFIFNNELLIVLATITIINLVYNYMTTKIIGDE